MGVALVVGLLVVLPLVRALSAPLHVGTSLQWLTGFGLFWAVRLRPDAARRAVPWLVGVGCAETVLALAQAAGLPWPVPPVLVRHLGAPGTLSNPNWLAAVLAPLLPLLLSARVRVRLRSSAFVLIAAGLAVTRSRGAILAAAVGCAALWLAGFRARRTAFTGPALTAGGLAFVAGVTAVLRALPGGIPGLGGRVFLWSAALALVREHPWTGVGLGGFAPAFPTVAATVLRASAFGTFPLGAVELAHNSYLQLAAEAGLPAVCAFVILLLWGLVRGFRAPATRPPAAALLVLAVHALVDGPFQTAAGLVLFFFLLGLVFPTPDPRPEARRTYPGRSLALGISALLLVNGARLVSAGVFWARAEAARASGRAERSLTWANRAAATAPEYGPLRSFRAQALVAAGRPREALQELDRARQLWFSLSDWYQYGTLLAALRERDEAFRFWDAMARSFPPLVRPHLELGRLYEQAGHPDAAGREYRLVLQSSQPTPAAESARQSAARRLVALRAAPLGRE